jgi:acetoin utilization protein AcuB
MTRELISVAPYDSVEEAVALLRQRGVRHLLVLRKGRLVGIISDRDIKRALDPRKTKKRLVDIGGLYFLLEPILVEEIMTPNPVSIRPDASVDHAAFVIVQRRFGALPVVDNGKVVGIITETDLLSYYANDAMERERAALARRTPPAARKRKIA